MTVCGHDALNAPNEVLLGVICIHILPTESFCIVYLLLYVQQLLLFITLSK